MIYCKVITDNYIEAICTQDVGKPQNEVTEAEYNTILDLIRNKPTAESGFDYRLREDLEWEMYELPPMPEDDELSAEEALEIITGGNAE